MRSGFITQSVRNYSERYKYEISANIPQGLNCYGPDTYARSAREQGVIKNAATVLIASGIVFAWPAHSIEAKVVRLVVERTTPYAGGKAFGEAGAFERLEGTVYM